MPPIKARGDGRGENEQQNPIGLIVGTGTLSWRDALWGRRAGEGRTVSLEIYREVVHDPGIWLSFRSGIC